MKEKKKKKRESKGEMSIGEVQESGTFKLEPSAAPAKKLDTVQTANICLRDEYLSRVFHCQSLVQICQSANGSLPTSLR